MPILREELCKSYPLANWPTNLFRYFVAVRNLVSFAVLSWDFVTLWHCHVVALLFRDILTVLSVVVGRLALLPIVCGALLLLFVAALLFVFHVALHLLFILATIPTIHQLIKIN